MHNYLIFSSKCVIENLMRYFSYCDSLSVFYNCLFSLKHNCFLITHFIVKIKSMSVVKGFPKCYMFKAPVKSITIRLVLDVLL